MSGLRRGSGSVAVEFALVIPVVLLVVLAVAEVAVVARAQLELINAAREGAREAATSPDPSEALAAARAALGGAADDARISVRRPHVVGASAEVVITLPHRLAPAMFGGAVIELKGRASMRVEQ